ncbi:MAG: molybdopterin-dependent oxidoreductase [Proteobacteria bacterium]|nr:molybdopterin-dependent oxidoreductase [Pseudomonadota bacterium]
MKSIGVKGKGHSFRPPLEIVGQRICPIDGVEKVEGTALYPEDLRLDGLLYGKILRSPHPHARIVSIDARRARSLAGVVCVVTAEETPKKMFLGVAPPFQDQMPLEGDKVRYVGDEVAAVAAESEEIAEKALEFIEVHYEALPAVFDPFEAMKDGAPLIHEGKEKNIAAVVKRNLGDPEGAFAESDHIFEDDYNTPAVSHTNLEPRCTVASVGEEGILSIWTPTQSPYFVRKEIAHVLDLSLSKVQIREINGGGGFGSRSKVCEDEAITALLAVKSGRPVRVTYTREEEFTATRTRIPFHIHIKTGVRKDGTLLARAMRVVADKGAYCMFGPAIIGFAAGVSCSLYRVSHVSYEAYAVYTNKHFGGPFRGFGAPQVTFAIESQMDRIAEELGIDPVELRLKNANQSGDVTAAGWQITSCGFSECLSEAAKRSQWSKKRGKGKDVSEEEIVRGIGIAAGIHVSGNYAFSDGEYGGATIKVHGDGRVVVYKNAADTGEWSNTAIAQIVAEELGVDIQRIRVISMDTETTPPTLGSFASRVCFIDGNAAKKAAAEVKEKLLRAAASELAVAWPKLDLKGGRIFVVENPSQGMDMDQAVLLCEDTVDDVLSVTGRYEPPTEIINRETGVSNTSAAYTFGAQVAEVEVNRLTGEVKVTGFTAAQDVGRAINPTAVEGQIEGSVIQGIGFALMEEFQYENGRVINPDFAKYMIPTSVDIPAIETILIETIDPEGPFGAKGVGELPLNMTAAAIANAVYDAAGVRIHSLPITPEKLYRGMGMRKIGKREGRR